MAKEELSLDIGDALQLQFLPEDTGRYYVRVIGYLPERSLLVTTPTNQGKVILVRESQPVAVRVLAGNEVIAFSVNVLRSCMKPYPYLHLSYPTEMQSITVRKAQRVNLDTIARVKKCGPEVSVAEQSPEAVKVSDMSTTGALLISPRPLGEVKTLLNINLRMKVAEEEESLNLVSVIRNARSRNNSQGSTEYLYGIEFQFTDRQEAILLHAYVYEQIVIHHG